MKERSNVAEPKPEINCSIFLKREWSIKELTRDINDAKTVSDKDGRVGRLKNEDYKNCRTISTLRKQKAEILIEAKGLEK